MLCKSLIQINLLHFPLVNLSFLIRVSAVTLMMGKKRYHPFPPLQFSPGVWAAWGCVLPSRKHKGAVVALELDGSGT